MKKEILPYTKLPNQMPELEPLDKLIYLSIKRFKNNKTGKCFPTIETISRVSGVSYKVVVKTIQKLVNLKYIQINKVGRQNYYIFSDTNSFECFTDKFLDFTDISFITKAYLAAIQQHMFIESDNTGKISYNNTKLSELINMSVRTIQRCQKELKDLGFLTINKTTELDNVKYSKNLYIYHLYAFGQFVYEIKHINDKVDANHDLLDKHNKEIAELYSMIEDLKKELDLKKTPTTFIL